MNSQITQNFAEYLKDKGYSAQTIHAYSKALEQAPDTWNTSVHQELYEHINSSLQLKQELNGNIKKWKKGKRSLKLNGANLKLIT